MVLLTDFRRRLSSIRCSSDTMLPSQMSRLERSMSSVRISSFRRDSTQPLAGFFNNILEWLEDLILELTRSQSRLDQVIKLEACAVFCLTFSQAFLSAIQEIIDYLRDLCDLGHSENFDEGIFQVYLGSGRSFTESNELEGRRSLDTRFARALDSFNASWRLSTGLSMERLWSTFRPPTARSLLQMKHIVKVEQLADRFDAFKWKSNASIDELERIQRLMALSVEISYREDVLDGNGLQVNHFLFMLEND